MFSLVNGTYRNKWRNNGRNKQEVGDDLSICVLNQKDVLKDQFQKFVTFEQPDKI